MANKKNAKGKRPVGRPSKYTPDICDRMLEFFSVEPYRIVKSGKAKALEVANDLPTFERFAVRAGVCVDTLNEWGRVHPEFSEAFTRCKNLQKDFLITNAIRGNFNAVFSIFVAKNITDMRDKQVVEHEGIGEFVSKFNSTKDKI